MDLIKFFEEVAKLKKTVRTGWKVEGVKNPESVADHSFLAALMGYILAKERKDLDAEKVMKILLVHDLAESQIGDILVDWKVTQWKTKNQAEGKETHEHLASGNHGVTEHEKHKMEIEAFKKLTGLLGEHGKELFKLFEEFEEQKTKEAVFANSIDKLEMLFQAYIYEKEQGKDMSHWFKETRNRTKDPQFEDMLQKLLKKRSI